MSRGAFHTTLDRLERKGFVTWKERAATDGRGGLKMREFAPSALPWPRFRISPGASTRFWENREDASIARVAPTRRGGALAACTPNVAMFSVTHAVLFRSLAYDRPEELVLFLDSSPDRGDTPMTDGNFADGRDPTRPLRGRARRRVDVFGSCRGFHHHGVSRQPHPDLARRPRRPGSRDPERAASPAARSPNPRGANMPVTLLLRSEASRDAPPGTRTFP